jgi:hypothetical protein
MHHFFAYYIFVSKFFAVSKPAQNSKLFWYQNSIFPKEKVFKSYKHFFETLSQIR